MRHPMPRFVLILLTLCGLCGLLAVACGCTSCRDVSSDPRYLAGGLRTGQNYILQVDALIIDINHGRVFFDRLPCRPGLWAEAAGKTSPYYGTLPTAAQWEQSHQPGNVRGVLAAGTPLILEKVIFYDYVENADTYYVFRATDGPQRGESFCFNDLMSPSSESTPRLLVPNPATLRANF